jgi:1-acyl-sn-glycerol-3-phosphate acyltransferase
VNALSNAPQRLGHGLQRLGRSWRLVVFAVGFTAFGVGCLAVTLLSFALVRLLPGAAPARRLRVRRLVGFSMRAFLGFVKALGALTYRIDGASRLGRPGQLIVANHPTLIDAMFLIGLAPSSSCIVKRALWHNLLTRGPVTAAGYVSNSPTDRMIEDAADALRSGQSVIIFPEGTRSVPGRPVVFLWGAAAIAVRAATVVTPVFIRCSPPAMTKGDPWYRIPQRRMHFSIEIGADLDPEPFRSRAPAPIAARELNERLLSLYAALERCE